MIPLLAARDVRKAFPGVKALDGVSFELAEGEVHALVGGNGAGKSTLINVMSGAVRPDSGVLEAAGRRIDDMTPGVARALGIAVIHQHPALFDHLSVAENIAFFVERQHPWRVVRWGERRRRAAELLAAVDAGIDPDRLAGTLSLPEQQLVEIAKAIGADAKAIVMDEPTASLSDREVARLFDVITRLKTRGGGVIYISHRLEEVFAIADRVTVLRDGRTVATAPCRALSPAALVGLMIGRDLSAIFPKRDVPRGDVALELDSVSCAAGGLRAATLSVHAGEIVGLAGLVGSGRTELARTIFGLTPADGGEMRVGGRPVRIASPGVAIACGIGYVPEDRRQHGVVGDMAVDQNISLASLRRVASRGMVDRDAERRMAETFQADLHIKAPGVGAAVKTLSGGNQQKVALAKWLATRPAVLILDEPTQGIDVGAKAEVHALMQELASRGLAILMISSEMPEILGMSDRVAVMRDGEVAGVLDRSEASEERVMAMALGQC